MAAAVLLARFADADLSSLVRVGSSGVSAEEDGNPIDRRAARALRRRGYELDGRHRAHRITKAELEESDLILPATFGHYRALLARGAPESKVKMMRQFEPALADQPASYQLDIEDPWYGTDQDFEVALDQIEAAAVGVVDYVRGQL
jgi:protein-tyrosine phosphatase